LRRNETNLAAVVCTKLSADDVGFLKTYARGCYNANIITQPTISHVLRYIVTAHRIRVTAGEKPKMPSNLVQPMGSSVSLPYARDAESGDKTYRMTVDKLKAPIIPDIFPSTNKRRATDRSKIGDTQNSLKWDAEKNEFEDMADEE
jgi:hypothetical protein